MAMTAHRSAEPQLLRSHARDVDALRSRLEQVLLTGRRIEQDQAGFGALCAWVLTKLSDRYERNRDGIAYVEENLTIVVGGLRRAAGGEQPIARWLGVATDVAAPAGEAPVAYDRDESLSRVMDDTLEWVTEREWVEPQLADAAPIAEFALPVDAAFAALRTAGLATALNCVPLVQQMLDDLSGAPDVVADQAACWQTIGADLQGVAADLQHSLDHHFGASPRPDVRAYLDLMSNNVEALMGLGAIAAAMAVITKAAGDLILLARDIIRGFIGDLFARVIVWLSDTSAPVSLPVLAVRLSAVVTACWRIHTYITALVTSVASLSAVLDDRR
ncbi:hypothetical protein ACPCHT_32150 [Nucisporomicrobium flavum]|uniref:hypothetical protein n=1 Tax=Nucisporomicrobium flavum TaxID=2785915 RepID=UPI003C2BD504